MSWFPNEHHLASWAAMCPGNNESAGKRKSGRTRRGNNYLKTMIVEAAWAVSRTKGTYLGVKYNITAKRHGGKRAAVAIGHWILKAATTSYPQESPAGSSELNLLETETPRRESIQ